MAALSGSLVSGALLIQLAARTPALDAYEQWRLPYSVAAATDPAGAPAQDTQPVTEIQAPREAASLPGFGADWYHRIHLLPAQLALGNLLSEQQRDVEIWNAHFEPQTLSAIEATGTEGIEFGPVAPDTYGPLEQKVYPARITFNGPPVINAAYEFQFDAQTPSLIITGNRVVVFAFAPNWGRPVLERLEWLTDVLRAYDGKEQRIQLRAIPRQSFEYEILAQGAQATFLDAILFDWQSRVFAIPVWTDPQRLAAPLPAGSTSIPVETAGYDYAASGLALLVQDARTSESVEIVSVAADSITLALPTQKTWPAGTRILPAKLARLHASQSVPRPTAGLAKPVLRFTVIDNRAATAQDSVETHQGYSVLTRRPNRAQDLNHDYRRYRQELDYLTGLITVDDAPGRSFSARGLEFVLRDRSDIGAYRAWLHARAGRLNPYYQPTWQADLTLTQPLGAAQTTLTIVDVGASLFYRAQPGRMDLALWHTSGQWYFRRITGVAAGDPGTELLSIDTALGIEAQPGDFRMIQFMALSRLEADAVEITWHTAGIAKSSITALEVSQ